MKSFFQKAWRWEKGRQGTGYDKKLLLLGSWPLPFDVYLLRYRNGQGVPPHTDPVKKGKHFRANLLIFKTGQGGEFWCEKPIYSSKVLNIFRSDISTHSVSPTVGGVRYVISLGWIQK